MLALACFASLLLALGDAPPVSTFASPSGAWNLAVSRPDEDWNGTDELVMTHAGVEVWRARHALGLREAFVSDEGRVGGFGYYGKPFFDTNLSRPDGPRGEVLRIFALDPSGAFALDESHPRGRPLYPDSSGNPIAQGAFFQPDLGRFVVRVADEDLNRGAEEWWAYDLATGAALARERPKLRLGLAAPIVRLLAARAVPGTPLVLVQWLRMEPTKSKTAWGALFQLVDPDWKVAWSLELARDYVRMSTVDLHAWIDGEGAILATAAGSFELRFVAEEKRVLFAVRRDGELWSVSESSRRPFVGDGPRTAPAKSMR